MPADTSPAALEDVWRREAPHVLATLCRRYDHFADCEDAVQLALIAAAEQWPRDGVPDHPTGWLIRVAARRLLDQRRADDSRAAREEKAVRREPTREPAPDEAGPEEGSPDDTLQLLVLCAHPALTPASQVALMLRAVGGLTTGEVAAGFLVPEPTMAQRISRAKTTLRRHGARLSTPSTTELAQRLLAVRHAIALLYTTLTYDGVRTAWIGPRADGSSLAGTVLRLARELVRLAPADPENAGLLALLLLTESRSPARHGGTGELVPLDQQERALWDEAMIGEGLALLEATLPHGYVGTFQLQAAIAAVHAEAPAAADTDWAQILALYDLLVRVDPSPAALLGRAVATAEVRGAEAGLAELAGLSEAHHRTHHRTLAVRGHLLAQLGHEDEARAAFRRAAELARSVTEQRYLNRLGGTDLG